MSVMGDLIQKGSVKDIYHGSEEDQLVFKFSDRYSVFDWGEMPDHLTHKGKTLALIGGLFFRWLETSSAWKNWHPRENTLSALEKDFLSKLRRQGLSHHYCGQVSGAPETMVVKKVEVPKLNENQGNYDYQYYQKEPQNCLVPLEVIFRFGVPEGSSLLKRVGDQEYLRVLGLSQAPQVGEWLQKPVLEFSTKLESTDRYMDYEEAQRIAGLSDYEFSKLHALTTLLAMRLSDLFSELGISLWDGKFEWAFGSVLDEEGCRDFVLVDSIGPDELRLSYQEKKLSKEFLRGFYRNTDWLNAVEEAKSKARAARDVEWKKYVASEYQKPRPLTDSFKGAAEGIYLSLARALCDRITKELGKGADIDLETAFLKSSPSLKDLVGLMDTVENSGDMK